MPWYVTVYELLLQVSLAGCVLLTLAWIAVTLLREPARKIRVIELTMAGLLALPLVTLIPGYPRVSLLPDVASAERVAPQEHREAKPLVTKKNPPAKRGADRVGASPGQPPALPGGRATVDSESRSPRAPVISPVPPADRSPSAAAAPSLAAWNIPTDYRLWIAVAYLSGVTILLAWSLVGLIAIRRLVRSSLPADAATRTVLRVLAGDASDRVRLLISPRATQPCAFGWLRPTIILPQSLVAAGGASALRFAIAHEWSHVTRGDIGVWTLSSFARLLHFQQPLLWLLRRHLRRSQDYLADAAAAGTATPEDYAEFLTSLSQNFKRPHLAPGLGIISRRSDLHRRVVMLVEKQGSLESVPPKRWSLAILVAGLIAVAVVASLRAEPHDPHSLTTEPTKAKIQCVPPSEKESASETRAPSASPTNENIEAVLAEDPQIRKLTQEQEALGLALRHSVVNGGTYNKAADNRAAYTRVTQLSREIARVEEQIDERKADLRSSVTKSLVGSGQRSATKTVHPRQESQTQRFMLGEGVRVAQNQATTAARRAPFSGKVRPGDILNIEIVGGIPTTSADAPKTVEPDGNVAIGAVYGDLGRIQIGGLSLIEAGKHIESKLRAVVKQPSVMVTYVGHDPDVIAEGEATKAANVAKSPAVELVVLAPLDTIEIILPLIKPRVHKSLHNGKLVEVFTGDMPQLSGTYIIEPDGRIALPQGLGRLAIAGMTEAQASEAMRKHLGDEVFTRTALPTAQVLKRGRAVFPEGKLPDSQYRIKPGDSLLTGISPDQLFSNEVDSDGKVGGQQKAAVAGLTLEDAQKALRKAWIGQPFGDQAPSEAPWLVTVGGWREEAASGVIDRIEGDADTRSLRLENEVQELKQMIRHLNLSR